MKIDGIMLHVAVTDDGCWEWTGGKLASGYGSVRFEGRSQVVHRVTWEAANGAVPDGLQLDHLCRNRACCNPSHLEAVTQSVNLLRGVSGPARNARKTHCIKGHVFDLTRQNGWRECSICKRERRRAHYVQHEMRDAS